MEDVETEVQEQVLTLSETDRMVIELAKARQRIALAQAEKALAQQEAADIGYKYTILQIYMKYGLSPLDSIDERGNVIRQKKDK